MARNKNISNSKNFSNVLFRYDKTKFHKQSKLVRSMACLLLIGWDNQSVRLKIKESYFQAIIQSFSFISRAIFFCVCGFGHPNKKKVVSKSFVKFTKIHLRFETFFF